MTLETYIVRIYRRGRAIPHHLVGIVEKGGDEGKQAFTCLDELWGILNPPKVRNKPVRQDEGPQGLKEGKPRNSHQIKQKQKGELHGMGKNF